MQNEPIDRILTALVEVHGDLQRIESKIDAGDADAAEIKRAMKGMLYSLVVISGQVIELLHEQTH